MFIERLKGTIRFLILIWSAIRVHNRISPIVVTLDSLSIFGNWRIEGSIGFEDGACRESLLQSEKLKGKKINDHLNTMPRY